MAKKFLTDAEMQSLEAKEPKKANFISDEEMSQLEAQEAPKETSMLDDAKGFGKRLLKSTAESLPTAGALLGGGAGFISPIPGGTIAGAAGGAYLGKAAENVIERYLLDEQKTRPEIYLEPVQEAAIAAAGEGVGQIAGKALTGAGKLVKKSAAAMSRTPEKVFETYAKRTKEVDDLIKKFGSDTSQATDETRGLINKRIEAFKGEQNRVIEKTLETNDQIVEIAPIKEQLQATLKKLDPKIEKQQYSKIKEKLDLLDDISADGNVNLTQLNKIKQNLQDASDYDALGNVLFKKTQAEVSLAKAASKARGLLNKSAPEIAEANNKLANLHRTQKNMNKNMLKEQAPEASILGAGTGENKRNLNFLSKLEKAVGGDFVSQAENLAAMKAFSEPGLLPAVNTGAAAIPLLTAGAGGLYEGDIEGVLKGLAVGSLGSPLVLKQAIKYGSPALRNELLKATGKGLLRSGSQLGTRGLLGGE